MKKMLALVLLLCLLCPCALAEGKLEMTEVRVVREVEEDCAEMKLYLQLTNTGDAAVGLDYVQVMYTNAQGETVCEESAYGMYPTVLQPGETGYVYNWSMSLEAAAAQSIVDYDVTIYEGDYYMPEVTRLAHEMEYQVEDDGFWTEHHVIFYLTNETDATMWQPCTLIVVRSTEGKILLIQDDAMYDVGLPAGSSLYYDMEISFSAVEAWEEAGIEVGSVETVVYMEKEAF